MTQIRLGKFTAVLEGTTWTSADAGTQKLLRAYTRTIAIHGGVPDAEQHIVLQLQKRFPQIQIVSQPPPPTDDLPEGMY